MRERAVLPNELRKWKMGVIRSQKTKKLEPLSYICDPTDSMKHGK